VHQELAEFVRCTAGLWDTWAEDAIITDRRAGRYLDASRVRAIEFSGRYMQVRGPSVTPRPPQGRPVTMVSVEGSSIAGLTAIDSAVVDVVIVRAAADDLADAAHAVGERLTGRERGPGAPKLLGAIAGPGHDAGTGPHPVLLRLHGGEVIDGYLIPGPASSPAIAPDGAPGNAGASPGAYFRTVLGLPAAGSSRGAAVAG
jgi:hypothetical protein